MPRKKENRPPSSMELRCLEKQSDSQVRGPGQHCLGGKPPRKILAHRGANHLRRPTRHEWMKKRREEALQKAAQELLDDEQAAISATTEDQSTVGDDESVKSVPETSSAVEASPESMDWSWDNIPSATINYKPAVAYARSAQKPSPTQQ